MNGFLQLIGVYAVVLLVPVTGISFTVNPDNIVLGSTGDNIYMRCAVLDEDVDVLNVMQIQRWIENKWETLALLKPSASTSASLADPLPNDLQNKGLDVSESYDLTNLGGSVITLTIPRNSIQCSDARYYQCSINYLEDTEGSYTSPSVEMNGTLMAAELPVITSLVGKKNGYIVEGPSPSYQAAFDVGDQLELTCTANIGSFEYTTIKWKQTSETSNEFIDYNPPSGTFTSGTANSNGQCSYTRTASFTYNTTNSDANRPNNLAFECYVTINGSPYNLYTTENNPTFYAEVAGSITQAPGAATAGGGDVGVIAGGIVGGLVVIVLVVLLVYFLWYKRRSAGQDYQTKEEYGAENPNMAPGVTDLYAAPDKTRKRGHENPGLDEPHEARRHHDRNGRGQANYGMDRDADAYDSRDGSPTMSNRDGVHHMGMDPRDGSIGTGV